MSSHTFAHIPDLELITHFAENTRSFFSTISPWSKVVTLVLLVLLVTVLRSLIALLMIYAATVTACWIARLPLRKILLWYALPVLFVLSLVGLLAWGEPGNPVFSVSLAGFTLVMTDGGLHLIGVLLVKALIIMTFSIFFLMTTRYNHIAAIIDRIFPDPLNQIFLLSYRFLFLTIGMTGSLVKAVRSRGGGFIHSIRIQGQIFAQVFALTIIRSFDRAERVHAAMAARGYQGTCATAQEIPSPSVAGILLLALAGAGTAWVVLSTEISPAGGFL